MKRNLLAILLLLLLINDANASLITYEYSGEISRATYSECQTYSTSGSCNSWNHEYPTSSNFFDSNILSIGDNFAGIFSYDHTKSYNLSSDGFQAVYLNAISNYQFEIGNVNFPSSALPVSRSGSLSIVNDRRNYDSFFVSQSLSGNDWFASTYISFQDNTGKVYDNFDIPVELDLNDFTSQTFHIGFLRRTDGDQLHLYGNISEFKKIEVPEPTSLIIFMSAFFLVFFKSPNGLSNTNKSFKRTKNSWLLLLRR